MSNEVAKIEETLYQTLEEAVQAVPTTNALTEIEMVGDYVVEAPITIPENTKVILDLAGHSITCTSSFNGRVFLNYGDFTIEDSVGTGLIDVSSSATGKGAASNYHLMKITGGTYRGNNKAAGATISNATAAQEFILDGGTIESSSVAIVNSSKVTINSGTVHGTADNYVAVQNGGPTRPNAELIVNGGTIIGDHDNAIYNAGKCTINNGIIEGHGFVTLNNQPTGTMNILGGTISHDSTSCVLNDGIMNIEGGTFENDGCASDVYCVNSGNGNDAAAITVKDGAKISGTFGGLRIVGGSGTLEGGTFEATGCDEHDQVAYYALYAAGYIDNVNVTVKDGTFTSANNAAAHIGNAGGKPASIDVQGGKFVGAEGKDALVVESDVATSTITGGEFSKVPEGGLEVPDGYEEVQGEDGTVTVQPIVYDVTLNYGHDSIVEHKQVNYGQSLAEPEEPTRQGYIFKFWSADGSNAYNFETILTDDLELTALWDLAIAELNSKQYKSLEEAFAALVASSPSEIKLLNDTNIADDPIEIASGYEVTLNLNDHKITMSGFEGRPFVNNGTLTIKSTTNAGEIATNSNECYGAVNNYGNLTLESGTLGGGTLNGSTINNHEEATLHVTGGKILGSPRGVQNSGTATFDGGEVIGQDTYADNRQGNGVITVSGGTTIINEGSFSGDLNAVSNMDGGNATCTISGGTFTSNGSDGSGAIYNGTGCTLTISDCNVSTQDAAGSSIQNEGTLVITGGTFVGDNCNKQTYTINSGQRNSGASAKLSGTTNVSGTFGAVRAVSGTLEIDGGTYKAIKCSTHTSQTPFYAVYLASENGEVEGTIKNGTFESAGNSAVLVRNEWNRAASLTVNGGSYTAPSGQAAVRTLGQGSAELYGGSYSSDVNVNVPEGYEAILQDGKYVITKVWNVTFNLGYEGAGEPEVVTVPDNTTIQQIPESPVRVGYTFKHWAHEGSEFSFETPITQDLELTAVWEIIKLTVTLNFNDGSTPNEEHEVDYGTVFEKPEDPTRTGFNFVQWNYEGQEYAFTDPITQDIELTAIWDAIDLSVTFDFGYEGKDPYVQGIEYGQVLQKIEDPEREGYTFTGWTKDGEPYTFEDPVTESFTLVANWEIIVLHVTFDFNVEGIEDDVVSVNYGSKVVVPETPENEGYKSLGWFDSEDQPFDVETPIVSDMTLHMNWEELPTIEDMLPMLDSIDDTVSNIDTTLADLKSGVEESDTAIEAALGTISSELTGTKEQVSQVKTSVDAIVPSLDSIKTSVVDSIGSVNTSIEALDGSVDEVNTSISASNTLLEKLSGGIEGISTNVSASNETLETVSTKLDTSIAHLSNQTSALDSLNVSVEGVGSSVDAVKTSVDGVKTSVDEIKGSVDGVKGSVDGVKTSTDAVIEAVNTLATTTSEIKDAVSSIGGGSGGTGIDYTEILTAISEDVNSVDTKLGETNSAIGNIDSNTSDVKTSIDALTSATQSLQEIVTTLADLVKQNNTVLNATFELNNKMLAELEKIRKGDTSDTPDTPGTSDPNAIMLLSFQKLVSNAKTTGEVSAIWQHDMTNELKNYCKANGYQYSVFPSSTPPAELGDLWLIKLPKA